MTRPKLLLTRPWPDAAEAWLNDRFDVTVNRGAPLTPDALKQAVTEYDALGPTVTDKLTTEVFAVPGLRLKVIGNFGVGYEHIDVAAARAANVVVANTPDVLTDATADIALLLMLMTSRRAAEGERQVRAGGWKGWGTTAMMGQSLQGKTLGLIGFGRIAQATARRARLALDMNILYYSRNRLSPQLEAEHQAAYSCDIDDIAARSDVLSLHCPGGAETHHMIDVRRLKLMKPSAILINTARGSVVDEAALAEALKANTIWAAGLDVYEREPVVHPDLLTLDNASLEIALEAIRSWRRDTASTLTVGLCGAQGSGKSTLVEQLKSRLEADGVTVAMLSLDDLYLSRLTRADLAERIHPLFQTRGVPGTHDVEIGKLILNDLAVSLSSPVAPGERYGGGVSPREAGGRRPQALTRARRDGGGSYPVVSSFAAADIALPRFNKATDNPFPPTDWPTITTPVDVILFEGWCVGARPQTAEALTEPANALERNRDSDAIWRTYANNQLAGAYQDLFARLDKLVFLAAPDFTVVYTWRLQQERALALRQNMVKTHVMTDSQICEFIQYYQRLTQHIITTMPSYADLTLRLDADRNLIETQHK
ncbi:MAG: hypothetical protein JF615_04925 [Asticcacaulis sp.]|nr:hypothetical protein [Asticcacaulis sp.]